MKINFWAESGILSLIPQKQYPSGNDLEIALTGDGAVFSVTNGTITYNVYLTQEEFTKLLELFSSITICREVKV